MKIKINSTDMNRMLKTVTQCIDQRVQSLSNICVTYDNDTLSIRGTDGTFSAVAYTPLLGGTGERFCVDGVMFARVCSMCGGEIEISTEGKMCTVRGVGRTRLPIVDTNVPAFERVGGKTVTVSADDLRKCFSAVNYAISTDNTRIVLTGAKVDADGNTMRMVALDGFQMSIEEVPCEGDAVSVVVPGSFLKLLCSATASGESVKIYTDGRSLQAKTDWVMLRCGLLTDNFVDYSRILPQTFATECRISTAVMKDALKASASVNSKQKLVKLNVSESSITVSSNSEMADYEANVPCETVGSGITIAFNSQYIMNAINAVDTDSAVIRFNTASSPAVMSNSNGKGVRLVLPVRVM